jgi:hypothetical protein
MDKKKVVDSTKLISELQSMRYETFALGSADIHYYNPNNNELNLAFENLSRQISNKMMNEVNIAFTNFINRLITKIEMSQTDEGGTCYLCKLHPGESKIE